MRANAHSNPLLYLVITGLLVGVLILDLLTRLGLAEWIFHIVPVGLCLLQRRPQLPVVVGFAASALVVIGLLASPPGADPVLAAINRSMGVFTIWFVVLMVRQTLLTRERVLRLSWMSEGEAQIAKSSLGNLSVGEIANALTGALAEYVQAQVAVLYRVDGDVLVRVGSVALDPAAAAPATLRLGEGIVGQAAKNGKPLLLAGVPPGYLKVTSGAGGALPETVVVAPVTADGTITGVIELGFLRPLESSAAVLELLAAVGDDVGVALRSALYRQHVLDLLQETQRQGEELQAQQEELRVANEELTEQGNALRDTQGRLETQQSELEETNAQLEAQTRDLERQKRELLDAQSAMTATAAQLERASRYKSEFLANMSHELRTPLNSSLILSKVLADNAGGNLTAEQVNYAEVIRASNNDLLALINDILDLSKIEAGHVKVEPESVTVADILDPLRATFEPVAAEKSLALRFETGAHIPASLVTDPRRLQQILRNLLSNALKFTASGSVVLRVAPAGEQRISFAVEDTGIGIEEAQRAAIFEAFHQADGSTSRKYGGTGLGLSISRELARLLGGAIEVQSTPGVGSVFILTLPVALDAVAAAGHALARGAEHAARTVAPVVAVPSARTSVTRPALQLQDDRGRRSHERLILIVEDDPHFAKILYNLAHELDLDCIHTSSGSEAAALAREHKPSGIILDVGLPDDSGLSVLERLKRDPATRHIPVHMLSVEDHTQPALELGAVGYTLKSAAREQLAAVIAGLKGRADGRGRKILVVEDDATLRESIALLLRGPDIEIKVAGTVSEALAHLGAAAYDCMVMDLALPDATGFELLERMSEGGRYASPPVIVYTGRALTPDDEQRLRRYSRSIIIKGARSPERLLDEVTLFLHRVEATLPPDQQKLLRQARQRDAAFEGRTILLAEDDVRNIYALSSVLEPLGAKLQIARNGREALERLAEGARIDLVLMDVMMPEMDGLTAMREIRRTMPGVKLPIIAITAKAMPEDRQACLDAGASDYVSKPIDVDKLLSLCRVWMPK